MEKSQTITELAKALVAFQKEMKPVGFDATNPFFKSKYATLSALVQQATPLLVKNGLTVCQLTEDEGAVTTILMHTSGEFLSSKLSLKPSKDDPQGHGSAITYARRYAYAAILGLVSEEDDDGNSASQPATKNATPSTQSNTTIGQTLTIKQIVINMGKEIFKTPDEFKTWRIDNNLIESLEKGNDYEISKVLMALKEKEVSLASHK